jgi:hypothetical protein
MASSSSFRAPIAALFGVLTLPAMGCDPGLPTFPPLGPDAGAECSDDVPCEDEGDVCLDGRCYAPCTSTCGPMEVCTRGVCMRGMPPDAGPSDAGPPDGGPPPPDAFVPDPCDSVTCEGATPFCRAGVCLECDDSASCGGAVPICDVGRGACVPYAPGLCAPCNTNLDCRGAGGENYGECVMRGGATEPNEKVCLPTCADTSECAAGYRCDGTHCIPAGGASCTQQLLALAGTSCSMDGDCAPVGATVDTGLVTGSCQTTCLIPCGTGSDCPASMTNCDSSIGGFCRP